MKSKNATKILTSLAAVSLVLGTTSLASAKGADHGKSHNKEKVENTQDNTQDTNKNETNKKDTDKKDKKDKKDTKKKDTKKKTVIKSKAGKTVEKRLNSVDTTISSITKSIDSFFGVNEDGTTDKELSEKTASKKYNSYKGKLKAEINKIRTINKQLKSLNKKNSLSDADYEALQKKSEELEQLAKDETKRVEALAEQASTPKEESDQTNGTDEQTGTEDSTEQTDTEEQTDSTEQTDSEEQTTDSADSETQTDDTTDQSSTVDTTTPTVTAP